MMKNHEKDSIEVTVKKPKVVQLNKGLIIGLIGVLVLVFVLIILNSYVKPHPSEPSSSQPWAAQKTSKVPDPSILEGLPQGYEDTHKIGEILSRSIDAPPGSETGEQKEWLALKQEQTLLVKQLADLKQEKASSQESRELSEGMNSEASHSAIFFAGSAPARNQNSAVSPSTEGKTPSKTATPDKDSKSRMEYPSEYQSQNMQNQKMDFLNTKPEKKIYNPNTVQYPVSKFIIQAGTVIPAVLQTQIVSSLPGMITAIVSQNVYDSITGQYLIVPKGSKLLGQYNSQISYGQNELQAKFVRIIRPDGSSITLGEGSAGVDQKGTSGFVDSVDNHWGNIIGAASLMTIFNIPAIVATNQMNNNCVDNGNGICRSSVGSTVMTSSLQSTGDSVAQVGSSITNKSLNIQPTITIHPGYEFSVMVTKDTIIPPYHTPMLVIPEISEE